MDSQFDATNIMVDLETMSTRGDAAIVSIGAVVFSEVGTGAEFYRAVSLKSCVDGFGLHMDPDTVTWWLGQSHAAKAALTTDTNSLGDALQHFATWVAEQARDRDVCIWGNGAAFDNPILRNAYEAAGMQTPWKFWNDRCYRTLKAMTPYVPAEPRQGEHHNALDDARHQARHASVIFLMLRMLENEYRSTQATTPEPSSVLYAPLRKIGEFEDE